MVNARNKGAAGEREFIGIIAPIVTNACKATGTAGIILSRNFAQSAVGGCDMDSLAHLGFMFEVKRHETLSINTWWKQIQKAVHGRNCWPVLAYRQNRQPWTFVVDCGTLGIEAQGRVFMEQEVFAAWFEKVLINRLTEQNKSLNIHPVAANTGTL